MSQMEAVVLHFGSRNKLAKALGISLPAVSRWRDTMPVGRAYQIEVLTKGKFKASDLIARDEKHE